MKEIFLSISIVAIFAALFRRLAPERIFGKQMKFLLACFFVASVSAAISGGNVDFSNITSAFKSNGGYVDFSEQTNAERKYEIAQNTEQLCREALLAKGIEVEKIYVIVNISGKLGISISEIKLLLSEDTGGLSERAVEAVRSTLGGDIPVTAEVEMP